MTWRVACAVQDIGPGEAYRLDTQPPITVFHADGEFFALDDTCTHGQSSLSEGYVEDCQVECVWHYARFDLRTGRALTYPAVTGLGTYPVRVEAGQVLVDLPD